MTDNIEAKTDDVQTLESVDVASSIEAARERRIHRFVWGFGVVMVAIAGGGFIFKLIEFLTAFTSGEPFQFSIIPVMTYLIVAAGFGCLFMWAYLAGQFKDIEGPKFRMLEMQEEFDRQS